MMDLSFKWTWLLQSNAPREEPLTSRSIHINDRESDKERDINAEIFFLFPWQLIE